MATAEQVRPVLESALAGSGLVLEDVAVTPAGKRRVVRVLLDRHLDVHDVVTEPTEPLTLDEVADATRLVGDALEDSDVLGEQPYTLEVSSPGVGRPLTLPRHFQRNVGRLVTVHHSGGEVTGRLVAAGPDALTVDVPAVKKTPGRTETIPLGGVDRAVVQVEFSRPDDPKES
ncbi:ribosome maturation factor RimP [Phycicoccus duodecadis]|uniref:Ribosome maturation factor RimP n=1 Tax=Phycicoccus duodecadis TaxID=173053 RepID=A0A2N3YG42_9MICO|nr:ribosome maturation factor RimP [Phycicoccus duodecadis]PKW25813.1 ribosome maturation factor RimP [Phycicoccus duodecadis]